MNIQEAKEEIKKTVRAYTARTDGREPADSHERGSGPFC